MSKPKISVVLVVKNEEKNIERCLFSVKDFADEIVVVDEESTDKTREIAKKFTDKIFSHKSSGFVEPARNFSIDKATGEWILILDADEAIPQELKERLRKIVKDSEAEVVWIPRKNIIFKKWIKSNRGWWPDYHARFFKKGTVEWTNKIHGKPVVKGKEMWLDPVESLAIIHENYKTIEDFIDRLNRYTTVESSEAPLSWDNLTRDQHKEFLSRFFARECYKYGLHGLVLSYLESMYSLVVSAKSWQRNDFTTEEVNLNKLRADFKKNFRESEYWFLTALINQTKNPLKRTVYKLNRKLISLSLK